MKDVYCYGLVELSSIYTLSGKFPSADSYKEVERVMEVPGGEATNAAVVLSRLGLKTKIAGTWLGEDVYHKVKIYFDRENVDTSSLELKTKYTGPRDLVFVSEDGRTVFGWFGKLWSQGRKWSKPKQADIKNCRVACLDPFMFDESDEAARLCVKYKKKYVTIDEKPGRYIIKNSDAVVISNEFIQREYPGADIDKLFREYTKKCKGLVVFTSGADKITYGSIRTGKKVFKPAKIEAVDTLGAGDTFRAGIAFGLLYNWDDDKTVVFAGMLAAMVCMSGPGVTKSPSLKQLNNYIKTGRV
jgi:sugar/nucleoside kinase (ribokinase family)